MLAPLCVFAAADIHWNGEVTVAAGDNGGYDIGVPLQIAGVPNLSGLSLISIYDTDEINPPFDVMNMSFELSAAEQDGGNFNLDFPVFVNGNPDTHWLQFYLVDTVTWQQIGPANFNPENNSQFTTFTATQTWPISYNGTSGGNDDPGGNPDTNPDLPPGFDPATDCYDILYVDEPECQEYYDSGEAPYNPNFVLTTTLQNPLGEDGDIDIIGFLQGLFEAAVKIMLPFLVLYTIWSGFMFVKARGNPDELDEAKENFKWVIIGALVVFGSWIIAEALKGTVDQITAYLMNEVINLL